MSSPNGQLARDSVERLRAGEPAAWEQLYRFVRGWIVKHLSLPRYSDRETIVSDTVFAVWKSFMALRGPRELLPFVITVARRAAKKEGSRSRMLPLSETQGETLCFSDPGENLDFREAIERLLRLLTQGERELLRLRYEERLSSEELCERLHVSRATLWKKNCILRRKLLVVLGLGRRKKTAIRNDPVRQRSHREEVPSVEAELGR